MGCASTSPLRAGWLSRDRCQSTPRRGRGRCGGPAARRREDERRRGPAKPGAGTAGPGSLVMGRRGDSPSPPPSRRRTVPGRRALPGGEGGLPANSSGHAARRAGSWAARRLGIAEVRRVRPRQRHPLDDMRSPSPVIGGAWFTDLEPADLGGAVPGHSGEHLAVGVDDKQRGVAAFDRDDLPGVGRPTWTRCRTTSTRLRQPGAA
jgi:hypothetical protein